ncbi:di-heme oxidoredictase family protein [Corallococcus terminator]
MRGRSPEMLVLLLMLAGCEPFTFGGSAGVVLGPGPRLCREKSLPRVTPLFAEGPAETGPIIRRREDGVLVTEAAGRVRGRHEREERFATFDTRSFENRSYRLVVEDAVLAGRSEIKLTYYPLVDVSLHGPGTNFRSWKMYGVEGNQNGGYTFHVNQQMREVSPRQLEQTVTDNAREGRPLRVGDILDFELGIYLAGADPMDPAPIAGGSAYFSDTFRYQVGLGGLTPENFDSTGMLGPSVEARLGAGTTVPFVALDDGTPVAPKYALSQLALNIQWPHPQGFLEGRRLFHTDFGTGAHAEAGNPPLLLQGVLGPLFNASSCIACHAFNGRGVLPPVGGPVRSLVLRLTGEPDFGDQLQPQEAPVLLSRIESQPVTLGDGEVVMLHRPVFDAGRPLRSSARLAPALIGLGLLEAVDEATLLEAADENDCDGDGISGRPALSRGSPGEEPRLGRFGWKAEHPSVSAQVDAELQAHLGVGVTASTPGGEDRARLVTYLRLLGVLPQRVTSPVRVRRGAEVFAAVGCGACHLRELTTGGRHPFEELRAQTVRPYTDLLLHDMGAGLADDSGLPEASEWRTAPLWGLGFTGQVSGAVNLLHDGRAGSVLEAVLWHGGEAQAARDAVVALPTEDRLALLAFLGSL